ncbi:hypothetical protein [Comamonas sp. JC664]|uniref:hypothetical protein n=1 Tax=Comamonas sp. JC664 TaxID=2801917 RepID=UPI00174C0726|nr:hypothetical protein [Comamonas sp. JC664]MBL0695053.1 hypothetical protein [Comamonas sp. JC664]GHH04459.1 hypothetical protein GCM10012319_73870 [Comamonas sp. KCTC 72670]
MNANDVIESYITDVAVRLPRSQRADVAFELRALLMDELQAKAVAAGHDADAAMAIELLRAFGRPEAVSARYLPALTIIAPSDGHRFLRMAVVGLALIWSAGLLMQVWQPLLSGQDVPHALGQWWGRTVIPSLWWPGVLAVGFGIAAWARRRWPQASKWMPRGGDEIPGGRAAVVLGVVGILCGTFVLMEPSRVLDVFLHGRAAPAAYEALTYTDGFRQRQAPWLFVLLLLNVPMLIAVIVSGRWTKGLRRMDVGLSLSTCAVMAWTVLDGPILRAEASDRTARFSMTVILACVLVHLGIRMFRTVRPAPALHGTHG